MPFLAWALPVPIGRTVGLAQGQMCTGVSMTAGGMNMTRRTFHRLALSLAATRLSGTNLESVDALPLLQRPEDLVKRLGKKAPGLPSQHVFQTDLFYPDYMAGVWETQSTLRGVACPAGYKLFGPSGSFEMAEKQVGETLKYRTRFLRDGTRVISDRAFNVAAIASATMGRGAVLDARTSGTDGMSMTIAPSGADGRVFTVSMRVIGRSQQMGITSDVANTLSKIGADEMHVDERWTSEAVVMSETVRQTVRLERSDLKNGTKIKEVETTSVFVPEGRNVVGCQRTCSYIPRADMMAADAKGRPVDVRWYSLSYSREG